MNRSELELAIVEVVALVLGRPTSEARLLTRDGTAAWDSLKHMEIVFAVEDAAGVQFGEHELASLDSVRAFVDAAARHHAA